jgi:ribosomal protein S18 acetylase RimI-like enzyme
MTLPMPETAIAMETTFSIRNVQKNDKPAIQEITYRTGYLGEDLTGRGIFDDPRLLYLIFIHYYPRYEPEHCFVAVDIDSDAVVGFICGTPDTRSQQARFMKRVPPRIALRALLFTSWRHPKTFRTFLGYAAMGRGLMDDENDDALYAEYPAHLHINLLPGHQRRGIGSSLMHRFERHMASQNVTGIHLQTTSRNHKAVPFYEKMGFRIIRETRLERHPMADELTLLTFAKKLAR